MKILSLGLKAKVLSIFAVSIFLVVSLLTVRFYTQTRKITDNLVHEMDKIILIGSIEKNFKSQVQAWKNLLLRGKNLSNKEKYLAEFEKEFLQIKKESTILKSMLNKNQEELLNEFISADTELTERYIKSKTNHLDNETFSPDAADAEVKGLDRKVLDPLERLAFSLNKEAKIRAISELEESLQLNSILTLFICSGALWAGWYLVNRVAKSLTEISQHLHLSSEKVTTASDEISQSGRVISGGASEQASALVQTSTAIEEISAMIERNAENAKQSVLSSENSFKQTENGAKVVEQMITSIGDINTSNNNIMIAIETSHVELNNIVQLIKEIRNQTKVINDIVFQTKILSFNASVEAARAGEHGKGFSVVAEEVGNLAQMSGNAAREISSLLENSVARVEETINNTKTSIERLLVDGKKRVDSGFENAQKCGQVLGEILVSIKDLNQMAVEINAASQEQTKGIKEINTAVRQLDSVTHQNAAAAKQTSGTAEELKEQADTLFQAVQILVTTVQGHKEVNEMGTVLELPKTSSIKQRKAS